MLKEFFKPTVIFFRLTNFPAVFQTIMNEILQNLINTREVGSFINNFINNFIVKTKKEIGHDKIMKEVIKRLVENDLYIKSEKYK